MSNDQHQRVSLHWLNETHLFCFFVLDSRLNRCVPFKNRCTNLLPRYKPRPPRSTHNVAAWSAGLVTPLLLGQHDHYSEVGGAAAEPELLPGAEAQLHRWLRGGGGGGGGPGPGSGVPALQTRLPVASAAESADLRCFLQADGLQLQDRWRQAVIRRPELQPPPGRLQEVRRFHLICCRFLSLRAVVRSGTTHSAANKWPLCVFCVCPQVLWIHVRQR